MDTADKYVLPYLIAVHLGAGVISSLPAPDPANCVKWSGRKYYRLSENIIEISAPAPLTCSGACLEYQHGEHSRLGHLNRIWKQWE